ncbi:MAG: nitroreductase family protein [Chloroflexi bacterium]|nr:nitroreductase family protein [Chloroflexota bacterium]MBV9600310.1 nitroreductase family protein [Chloroflexota bacterium]
MTAADRLTMPLGEAIFTQRAIRRLKDDPISDADLETILAAAARAPSGGNLQPWRFLAVRDQKLKDQLARWYVEAYWARRNARGFAGPKDIPKDDSSGQAALHFSTSAENYARAPILLFVIAEHRGADVSTACQNLLLAARALGIGGTITSIGGIHEEDVHRLLGIPDGMDATCCIPLGWPEGKFGPARRKPLREIAFVDHFGTPGPWSSAD